MSGTRFAKLSSQLAAKGAKDPDALAAWIGRKKLGKAHFQKLAAHARANSSRAAYRRPEPAVRRSTVADTKTPAKPYGDVTYADPKNGKYPVDTEEHARAAWSYINKPENAAKYPLNGVSLDEVKGRIEAACKKFGITIRDGGGSGSSSDDDGGSRADTAGFDGFLVRSFPLEDIHILRAGDGRTVEAYAAVFDSETDIRDPQGTYREVIDRAAFNRAIDKARPQGSRNYWLTRCFYNHGMTLHGTPSERFSVPIGVTQDIRVEPRGLLTVTRYSNTPFAEEILENIRNGAITGHSFTGRIVRSDPSLRPGQLYRGQTVRRLELGLSEYGPTPIPFYADAEIVGVRAALAYTGTAEPAGDHEDGPLPDDDGSLAGEAEQETPAAVPGHESLTRRMAAYAAAHGLDLSPRA